MTGKELLYVEDALGHIKHMKTICETYSRNQELEKKFLNVLGGATNGR